jgi:hypothetical protein
MFLLSFALPTCNNTKFETNWDTICINFVNTDSGSKREASSFSFQIPDAVADVDVALGNAIYR